MIRLVVLRLCVRSIIFTDRFACGEINISKTKKLFNYFFNNFFKRAIYLRIEMYLNLCDLCVNGSSAPGTLTEMFPGSSGWTLQTILCYFMIYKELNIIVYAIKYLMTDYLHKVEDVRLFLPSAQKH